jgi:hypothetical protein
MPYELAWEPNGVVKRFFGHVTSAELLKAGTDTEGDARFDGYRYVINDFLDCTGFDITTDVVDEIAAIDEAASAINSKIRIAVVATAPEIIAAATQYANSPMNVYPTRLFSTQADARSWLALPILRA